ncbi:CHAT domain-containing protein [Niveispirillum fermenti]|uniref:CHAT domain-containing protein n=1 Tax=Niveispirillum fermenti TaxID=1233113 RepID=UPI0040428A00
MRDWENRRANRLRRQQQDAEARLLRQRDEHARLALSMPDTSQPRIAELDTSNQQLLADIERIKAELNDLPRAALLTQGIIQPERLFNQMQPDEAIVTFFVGHRHTYGMRVNSDRTMEAWRTDLTLEQATQWVDDIIASVAVPPGSKIRPYPVTKAHSLYVGLFGQDMQRVQGVETMTIVADNVLARLPFSALVTGDISRHTENDTETKSELNQLRQTRWLIDTVAVAHASSLKSLVLLRELATDVTPSEKYYIGFSTPDQASDLQFDMLAYGAAPPASGMSSDGLLDSDQLRCAEEARWIRNLGPLPHAPEEIDEVRKRLNLPASSSLTGTSFRRQTLMNRDMAGYRILHFASHAVLPQPQHTCIREPALQISLIRSPRTRAAAC